MPTTFEMLSQAWSEDKRPLVKHSTMCAYRLALRTHLLPRFGTMRTIDEREVQQFIIDKVAGGLARKTVRDLVAVLRAIVKYGARHRLCAGENWVLAYPPEANEKRLPVLSLSHHRHLLRHLTQAPSVRNIGVLLALCTGMRIGEVCALKWEDVDLVRRMIKVRHTAGRVYNSDLGITERTFSTPKTKHSFREIPVSPLLFAALCQVKRLSPSSFVVGHLLHGVDPRCYRDYFGRLLKRLGIPPIVFHGLRHTFATRCIESQCDYKTVSSLLGHSNVATTLNLYVHPNVQQKKRCIEKMSRFVGMG